MRNFVATVKEREVGQPCFVVIELYDEGQDGHPVLNLRAGTDIEDAKALAKLLNTQVDRVRVGLS